MTRKLLSSTFAAAAIVGALIGNAGLVFAGQKNSTPAPAGKMMGHMMPARDAKGRFMKAAPGAPKMMGHMMPPRDAKGRFMKTKPTVAATPKAARKMPPRDAKGRFMKMTKSPTAPK